MGFADNFAASKDPRVIDQVTAAIYGYLQTVESEVSTTANHVARLNFANRVALGIQSLDPLILNACCFASLSATSTDQSCSNAVATLWNLWSGV
jgi:hypothetical protein